MASTVAAGERDGAEVRSQYPKGCVISSCLLDIDLKNQVFGLNLSFAFLV